MSWSRDRIVQVVDEVIETVFGEPAGSFAPEATFAGDLMAESLDYVDIELHLSQRLGTAFEFSQAVDELRAAAGGPVRIVDLVDYLHRRHGED